MSTERDELAKAIFVSDNNAELVPMVACVDTETRARIWNEGYEAAMAQHLADDPSVADDWLNEQKAKAWDEGYQIGKRDHCDYWPTAETCDISSANPYKP
jgi:hypothetical protein